jgi:predicted ATPase with chaperone activity
LIVVNASRLVQTNLILEARKRRRERLIVPHQNAAEAAVVDGLSVFGATSLR